MSGPDEPGLGRPGAAVRLIFTYEGDEVRLLSRHEVRMTLPPGDPVVPPGGAPGVWAEVRSRDDGVLYRQRMADPLRGDVEVFSDDPQRSVSRTLLERPQGGFTVVVPDYAEGDYLALVAVRPGTETAAGRAGDRAAGPQEIVRVPLRPAGGRLEDGE